MMKQTFLSKPLGSTSDSSSETSSAEKSVVSEHVTSDSMYAEVSDYFNDFCPFLIMKQLYSNKEYPIVIDDIIKAIIFIGVRQKSKIKFCDNETEVKIGEVKCDYIEVGENTSIYNALHQKAWLIEAVGIDNLGNIESERYHPDYPCRLGRKKKSISFEDKKKLGRALLIEVFQKNHDIKIDVNDLNNRKKLDEKKEDFRKFYTYLLLDSRKIVDKNNINYQELHEATFYVGKGENKRIENHAGDAMKILQNPDDWIKKHLNKEKHDEITVKHQKMIDIWRDDKPVLMLRVSSNISSEEAFTQEGFLMDAIGFEKLTNKVGNNYLYYPKASPIMNEDRMPEEERRKVGNALLMQAINLTNPLQEVIECVYSENSNIEDVLLEPDEWLSQNIESNEAIKESFDKFKKKLSDRMRHFEADSKNILNDVSIYAMLNSQSSTATRDVECFAQAISYVFLDNDDLQHFKQLLREAAHLTGEEESMKKHLKKMYDMKRNDQSIFVHKLKSKLPYAEALHWESLYACVLGRGKANNVLISINGMMAANDLREAGVVLLENTRKSLKIANGAYIFSDIAE